MVRLIKTVWEYFQRMSSDGAVVYRTVPFQYNEKPSFDRIAREPCPKASLLQKTVLLLLTLRFSKIWNYRYCNFMKASK